MLLDTHVWLWMLTAPERLGDATGLVADPGNELLLSAASSWEIAIKYAFGRLPLPEAPRTYVPDRIRSTAVTPLPIGHPVALAVADLPDHHRDPFDRLLIAHARAETVPLLTADAALAAYDVDLISIE